MTTTQKDPVYFLLVDDLEENLLSLDALLRREGVIMLKARSGPEALELLLKHEIALALLDVQMPGMNGFELAELMRGTERTKTVPIIFLTAGHAGQQRRFRGYEAGAVDFLEKPIEPDILRSKAEVFYELYRQRQLVAAQRDAIEAYALVLKDADRRKDEFLATLAHELRNPLAPIRNGLQILRMAPDSEVSENVREMMDRQLAHLVRLIDDLLDISRVSQGKIELRRDHISLQSIIQAATEASRPLIEERKHKFTVDMPSETLWLYVDLTRVAQVVSNLLNNAAKYTPDGGEIHLSAKRDDGQIRISVSDNGRGIPEDMLLKVFEMFTQVDSGLDRAQGGLGIGLALVARLVEMHGGNIFADSGGMGKGSIFTVLLPLSVSPESHMETQKASSDPPGSSKSFNILVVDDNVPSAQTMTWMLESMGHEPALATNGHEALELAKKMHPDVILLDIGLPDINGYEVCRTLRKDPLFKNTVIIAQTGWGQERDKQEAAQAGFDHHLVKPVNFETFSELLKNLKKPGP